MTELTKRDRQRRRAAAIYAAWGGGRRNGGKTMAALAAEFHVSRQRVQQIVAGMRKSEREAA